MVLDSLTDHIVIFVTCMCVMNCGDARTNSRFYNEVVDSNANCLQEVSNMASVCLFS